MSHVQKTQENNFTCGCQETQQSLSLRLNSKYALNPWPNPTLFIVMNIKTRGHLGQYHGSLPNHLLLVAASSTLLLVLSTELK